MLDDQRYMLERIVEIIKEKNPDALLIAGDIYDKSLPSAEAVELFDSFMTEIAGLHGKTGLKNLCNQRQSRFARKNRLFQQAD